MLSVIVCARVCFKLPHAPKLALVQGLGKGTELVVKKNKSDDFGRENRLCFATQICPSGPWEPPAQSLFQNRQLEWVFGYSETLHAVHSAPRGDQLRPAVCYGTPSPWYQFLPATVPTPNDNGMLPVSGTISPLLDDDAAVLNQSVGYYCPPVTLASYDGF